MGSEWRVAVERTCRRESRKTMLFNAPSELLAIARRSNL
jgi:hypothetical protein